MSYRLGVDVGGTFTDLLLFDEFRKTLALEKVPTTMTNQALGIVNGVEKITKQAGIKPSDISFVLHGTTAATNAVLEAKGVKTALITTEGFRDVLQIMRQDRPKLYDFFTTRPDPLVPRNLRLEVKERILYTGQVHEEIDEPGLKPIIKKIKAAKVRAVAVCLLHSYANPVHEQKVREALTRECPGVYVSISSEILPEIREYDRVSTTVINVYVLPIIDAYLNNLSLHLKQMGINRTVHVMQSNGGIMPSSLAGQKSASTILSGPAAGVLAGVELTKLAGLENVITVDMGGTSFDICLAHKGKPKFTHACKIGGHALKIPMIDIHAIGAGGGSIAWIDEGGAMRVGPHSAGADPGPVCYAKGGKEPTVTDANLVLRRLNPDFFLGGEMEIDVDSAHKVISDKLAKPLGMKLEEAAEGVIRIVNASMVKGIRYVSVEKGYDPREFGLVCFGGNGPLHAVELAEELDIPQVIIPFAPGVNCAYGLLVADFRYDYVQTYLRPIDTLNTKEMNSLLRKLERNALAKMAKEDIPKSNITISRSLDLRYVGQGYELEVPLGSGPVTKASLADATRKFNALHQKTYGFYSKDDPTEVVNIRISCQGLLSKPHINKERCRNIKPTKALKGFRSVFLKGKLRKTAIYDRGLLDPGTKVKGPAIIEQKDSTTLLFGGNVARIDGYRNIIIKVRGGR